VRLNGNGVVDLPIRLMIVVLIVCISVPLLTSAMECGESENAAAAMDSEIDKIFNAAAAVHYSGIGSSRTVSVTIPDGSEIVIPGGGGPAGYSVHKLYKGRDAGTRYMESPPIRFVTEKLTITHSVMLLMTSDIVDGQPVVRVSVV